MLKQALLGADVEAPPDKKKRPWCASAVAACRHNAARGILIMQGLASLAGPTQPQDGQARLSILTKQRAPVQPAVWAAR